MVVVVCGGVWCGARYLVVAAEPVLLLDEIHQRVVQSGAVWQEETRTGRDSVEEEEALRKHRAQLQGQGSATGKQVVLRTCLTPRIR